MIPIEIRDMHFTNGPQTARFNCIQLIRRAKGERHGLHIRV